MDEYEIELNDVIPCLIKNVKEDTKDFSDLINLDSSLNREISIGDIECGLGSSVDAYIRFWNKQDEGIPIEERTPIKMFIDSGGGSLTDTLSIVDSIKLSKTPVYGICTGCAYSGGFFILISCHKRFGYERSSYLFHEGSTGNSGTSGQFQNYTEFYKKQLTQLKNLVINSTKINEKEYSEIKREDVWYDANEALKKGIIDEIPKEFI
jgi:ATP-dependent Clp protease protease subunit